MLENESGEDLFQLGEVFVGVRPLAVQNVLGGEIIKFLTNVENGKSLDLLSVQNKNNLNYYLLNRPTIDSLLNN